MQILFWNRDFLMNEREEALKVILNVEQNGSYSNLNLNNLFKAENFSSKNKGLISEIVYGVIRNKRFIDHIILQFSNVKFNKISPPILAVLRMGVYQIWFLDRVPDSAACDESVKLATRYGHKASAGFVNAVLRNVSRLGKDVTKINLPNREENILGYLCVKYSFQEFMVEKWLRDYGKEFTEEMMAAMNKPTNMTIRVNTLKIKREELKDRLVAQGYDVYEGSISRYALHVVNPGGLYETSEFTEGLFYAQDEASMLVAEMLNPKPGDFVIDLCAAPGGKATHIAEIMNNDGHVLACDVYDHKLTLISQNVERLGTTIVEAAKMNALIFDKSFAALADAVLADCPCTGYGVIGKKPEIKWSRSAADEEELVGMQSLILKTAAAYTKPGGTIVYSTCTVNREENENQIAKFLEQNSDITLEETRLLYPHTDGTDGFYIARLRKRSSRAERGKCDLSTLTLTEIKTKLADFGEPKFRAAQIYKWLALGAANFDDFTNIPKELRAKLNAEFSLSPVHIKTISQSKTDQVTKYAFQLADKGVIESVLMKYSFGNTVCISTQVGCKMGCVFCVSSSLPFERNLTPGEMLAQVVAIQTETGERVSNVVLMGIGEPFDNYDNVMKFCELLHYPEGLGVSYRKMTISTCGLIPMIEKFNNENKPINLSISLHSPYDADRTAMMPVNKAYPIDSLLEICNIYTSNTMRRLTFEYAVIFDENDSPQHAKDLAKLLKGMLCHVNLIPLNETSDSTLKKSSKERVEAFRKILKNEGIETTVRLELGSDIEAACGQLRKGGKL